MGSPFEGSNIRRKLVLRTPYGIYYAQEGRRIVVHAIINQRDDPERLHARTSRL